MCGCEYFISDKTIHSSLLSWRDRYFKKIKDQSHDSNDECILLEDILHSQPHINLHLDEIFLNWGGNNERNVESLRMILFSVSLDYLSPPSTGSLKRML